MSETYFPFASVNGDRKYGAEAWASYFSSVLTNGVFFGGTRLQVLPGSGMTVTLSAGMAFIDGYHYRNTDQLTLRIDAADGVLNRIDRVVIRWNRTDRNITARVIKGNSASSPSAPALMRTADIYDLGIATIRVPAGSTAVSSSNITDTRLDAKTCGIVSSLITPNTDGWWELFEGSFESWFEEIKEEFGAWLKGLDEIAGDNPTAAMLMHMVSKENPHGVTADQIGAAAKNHTHTAASIGAAAEAHTHGSLRFTSVSNPGTISKLREVLDNFLQSNSVNGSGIYCGICISMDKAWISYWNNKNTTAEIGSGSRYVFHIMTSFNDNTYCALLVSSYNTDRPLYFIRKFNGEWSRAYKLMLDDETQPPDLRFRNIAVPTSAWEYNSWDSAPGYNYRATISCPGVTDSMTSQVVYSCADAVSGNFAPISITNADVVRIYAKTKPAATVTIPLINTSR